MAPWALLGGVLSCSHWRGDPYIQSATAMIALDEVCMAGLRPLYQRAVEVTCPPGTRIQRDPTNKDWQVTCLDGQDVPRYRWGTEGPLIREQFSVEDGLELQTHFALDSQPGPISVELFRDDGAEVSIECDPGLPTGSYSSVQAGDKKLNLIVQRSQETGNLAGLKTFLDEWRWIDLHPYGGHLRILVGNDEYRRVIEISEDGQTTIYADEQGKPWTRLLECVPGAAENDE